VANPTNPQAISKKAWQGFTTEAAMFTPGAAPTLYAPGKLNIKRMQAREYISDERGTRDADNDVMQLIRHGEWSRTGNFWHDSLGYLFVGSMGQSTDVQPDVSGAPTAYKHAFALQDIPPTITVWKSYHQIIYFCGGAFVEKWTIKWTSEKALEMDASGKSLYPTKYTGAALTPTYSTVKSFTLCGAEAPPFKAGVSAALSLVLYSARA
jgi:hypothetical protein